NNDSTDGRTICLGVACSVVSCPLITMNRTGATMTKPTHFDEAYYASNGQLGDRPALGFYTRLVRRHVSPGPYLDYGCGTGHLVRRLAELGPAEGFEVSAFSAATARRTAACRIHESTEMLPSGSFGGLTSIHVV